MPIDPARLAILLATMIYLALSATSAAVILLLGRRVGFDRRAAFGLACSGLLIALGLWAAIGLADR